MSRPLKKTTHRDCGHDAAVINFGDMITVICACGSVSNSPDGWFRNNPHAVYETDTCEPPPLLERQAFDLTPSVSRDGGKTWQRVDDMAQDVVIFSKPARDVVFFVSCIEDSAERRHAYLLGPYTTHAEALGNVERGRELAKEADTRAHHYSFGTCSIAEPTERKGMFGK